jgi:Flp pilus assembly protein TadG
MSAPFRPVQSGLFLLRARGKARQLAVSTRGVAAIEFAMVLPVMVLVFFGMAEMTSAVNTNRKIIALARTLADLTGRVPSMNSTDMDTIFGAGASVMAPYKNDQTKMVVSSIVVTDTGNRNGDNKPILEATVCWSQARGPGATALAKGAKVPVPEGFGTARTSFVQADVETLYAPMLGAAFLQKITGSSTLTLQQRTPWPVRTKEVVWSGTTPCLP